MKIAICKPIINPWDMQLIKFIALRHNFIGYMPSHSLLSWIIEYKTFATVSNFEIRKIPSLQFPRTFHIPIGFIANIVSDKIDLVVDSLIAPNFLYDLIQSDFNVIHVSEPSFLLSFVCAIASRRAGIPLISTEDEIYPRPYSAVSCRRFVLDTSSRVIATSDLAKEKLLREGFDPKKIVLVPYSVDTERFRPDLPQIYRTQLGLNESHKIILYVGRLTRGKGIENLIYLMSKIRNRIQNVKLVLVGDGFDRNRLMSIAAQRRLTDNIIFAGALSYDKVHLAYAIADVFVLPTMMKERFGISLIEAMACAKPIVASRIGHVPQLIKDGFNGLLVSPNSISELYAAIMTILQQPALAKRMGLRGRALVEEKYSARQNASMLSEIYENIVF